LKNEETILENGKYMKMWKIYEKCEEIFGKWGKYMENVENQ
jgi:hypothetical protein